MSKGKIVGYVRVSSDDQNPDRQLEGIALDKRYVEFASGRSIDRPKLRELLDYVREDDTVFVHSMDRLARNLLDLRKIVDNLISKGVKIVFLKESLAFDGNSGHMSNFFLSVMGAFAEFELAIIRERQREGIELAKKKGIYTKGRPEAMTKVKIDLLKDELMTRKSLSQICRNIEVSRTTLYRFLKERGYKKGMKNPWELIE